MNYNDDLIAKRLSLTININLLHIIDDYHMSSEKFFLLVPELPIGLTIHLLVDRNN